MYKLLTTAAVIMTVATPSIADQWTGHKDLVNKLEQTYGYLDGEAGFANLQGAYKNTDDTLTNDGQLSNFFDLVDKGVTYIGLEVNADHTITPTINKGVAFADITAAKDELVTRVNYDLFVDTNAANFDKTKSAEYLDVKTQNLIITGEPSNGTGDNDIESNQNGGYAGEKITNLVTATNTINDYLIDPSTNATDNLTFQTEFDKGILSTLNITSPTEVDINDDPVVVNLASDFFSPIDDLNGAIGLTTDGSGNFFGNIDAGNVSETTINNFAIPAYNSFDDIGSAALGHSSISNWANGIYNYATANGGSGTFTDASGTATIDAAANTITINNVINDVAADGTLTPRD